MPHAFLNPLPLPLPISLAIINQMNNHTRMFSPTLSLEYLSHDLSYYFPFINFITWNFDQGYYKRDMNDKDHDGDDMPKFAIHWRFMSLIIDISIFWLEERI